MSTNTILASAPLTSTGYHLKANGTTLGNSLIWDNGTNVGIGNTNTSYTLDVSGTLRNTTSAYFATTSGNVGIGTTTATNKLTITNDGNAANALRINDTNANASFLSISASNTDAAIIANGTAAIPLDIYTGGSARVRVSATGNVGIGTSSPAAVLEVAGTSSTADFRISRTVSSSTYFYIKAPGGTPSTANMGVNGTDVMSITSAGNVGIGRTPAARLEVQGEGTTSSNDAFDCYDSSSNVLLRVRNDGLLNTGLAAQSPYNLTIAASANCHIYSDGTLFRATSSKRYKTDIEDLSVNTFELINKIRPVWYRSLCERDKKDWSWYGFIAEELAEIDPRFVQFGYASEDYIKDEITNETKLKENAELRADGVMYDRLTVLLIKAIQEQQAQIQNLQEQINILAK